MARKGRYKRIAARKKGRRSDFEVRVEAELMTCGVPVTYESDRLNYTKEATYVPDFKDCATGVYFEAKGRFTSHDRSKMVAVKKAHPDLDIRLIFMRNQKLYKGSKTTYLEWAAKHNFPASVFPNLPI